jgi:hypothetical protein
LAADVGSWHIAKFAVTAESVEIGAQRTGTAGPAVGSAQSRLTHHEIWPHRKKSIAIEHDWIRRGLAPVTNARRRRPRSRAAYRACDIFAHWHANPIEDLRLSDDLQLSTKEGQP